MVWSPCIFLAPHWSNVLKNCVLEVLHYIYNNQISSVCADEYKDKGNPRGKTSCQYHPLVIRCIGWCCSFTFLLGRGGWILVMKYNSLHLKVKNFQIVWRRWSFGNNHKCTDCMEEMVILE